MSLTLLTNAQSSAWITGNQYTRFTDMGMVTEALPQPGGNGNYSGGVAEHSQYLQFSEETGILFFIIDGSVYDRDGFLIADNDALTSCDYCMPVTVANVSAIQLPGHCDKFWLFFSNYCAMLDLSLTNPYYPNKHGRLINWDPGSDSSLDWPGIENYLNGDLEAFGNTWPQGSSSNVYLFELEYHLVGGQPNEPIRFIDVFDDALNGDKYLAVLAKNTPYIYRVSSDGVWLEEMWINSFGNPGDQLLPYTSIEFSKNSSNEVLVATSISTATTVDYNSDNLFLFRADASMSLLSVNSENAHLGGVDGAIGDLAFSPNGDYLYFGLDEAPFIGYYHIPSDSFGDLSSVLSLSQAEEAGASQLEIAPLNGQSVLCFAGPQGLSYLTSPDNPSNAQLFYNALPLSNLAQLNLQTPYSQTYLLQHQAYNDTYEQSVSILDCCEFFAEQLGEDQVKVEGSQNWSPGANPFYELDGVVYFDDGIVFEAGSTTIIDNLEFRFGPFAKVTIEAGAYVELNDCLWTSSCNRMWLGTDLLGTTNAAHSISQSASNQGHFRLNDSTIEHARTAISVGTNMSNSGGVVYSYGSTFRNNGRDVQFRPYRFVTSGGNTVSNWSKFFDSYFITDDYLNYPQFLPQVHVELNRVFGVRIERCSFLNTTPYSTHGWDERGIGISAIAASFNLSGTNTAYDPMSENLDATSFYRLQFGIRSTGFSSTLATYRCRYQEFQECAYGIVNFQTNQIEVYENNFSLMSFSPLSGLETMVRGIYLTGSTGYEVQQNYFTFDGAEAGTGLGVWVDESGPYPNQIRNNTFNRLKLGIYVSNENALFGVSGNMNGLQLLCNTFIEGITDIYRAEGTSMRHNQGGGQAAGGPIFAGNIFSEENPNCTGIEGDFRNHPNQDFESDVNGVPTLIPWQIDYFCPFEVDIQVPVCDDGNGVFDAVIVTDATHVYDCGPAYLSYSGGALPEGLQPSTQELIDGLVVNEAEHNGLMDYYESWIDDGVTEASLQLVANAFPSESEFVRDIMLERLPLSDDVLRTFVSKAENYDPWHLTQVFLANSPLHPRFLNDLEASEVLSPFFMSLIQAAQEGANPRHELENELSVLSATSYHLKNQLARKWLHTWEDESGLSIPLDSLREFASYTDHQLQDATHELYFGNASEAGSQISSTGEWAEFQEAFALLSSLSDTTALDTLFVSGALGGLIHDSHPGVASMALAMQHAFLDSSWLPNPKMSTPKALQKPFGTRPEALGQGVEIAVYPNPTSNRTMLTYPDDWSGNAQVSLHDISGRQVLEEQLTGNGVFELLLGQYPQGLYVLRIVSEGETLGQTRITLQN